MNMEARKYMLLCSLSIPSVAFGQCQYEAIAMEELCNGGWSPRGVNDPSVVVGGRNGCTSANFAPFIWTAENGTTYLPLPPGQGIVSAVASRIANDGTIAGTAESSNGLDNLVVWRTDGTVTMYMPAAKLLVLTSRTTSPVMALLLHTSWPITLKMLTVALSEVMLPFS